MKVIRLAFVLALPISACAPAKELTPVEVKTRNAGVLLVVNNNCSNILGYQGVGDSVRAREKLLAEAKAAGATQADITEGYNLAGTAFALASGIGGARTACASMAQSAISIIDETKKRL